MCPKIGHNVGAGYRRVARPRRDDRERRRETTGRVARTTTMRRARRLLLLAFPAVALGAFLLLKSTRPAQATPGPRVPVLVELFTSEGCSSCPPADVTLARLAREQPVDGALVVPLAWHVDYWDYIGWADPFASKASTERQREYAPLLGRGSLYTPQAVVDGRAEMNGSDGDALARAVGAAARAPKANVTVTVRPDGDARVVDIVVGPLPAGAEPSDVLLVVVEDEAHVDVRRGENAGRTLDHVAMARQSFRLGPVSSPGETRLQRRIDSPKRPSSVTVIVSERLKRKVWGVGVVPRV
jgi:hypothetical protein